MKRLSILFILVGSISFGYPLLQHAAAINQESIEKSSEESSQKGEFERNGEYIQKRAQELGIDTTGKDTEAILKEIKVNYIKKQALALGIDIEGKDTDT